jgi:hypothetical protein
MTFSVHQCSWHQRSEYQRLGYQEIFRWESVPTIGRDDVHSAKTSDTPPSAEQQPDLPRVVTARSWLMSGRTVMVQ